MSTRINNSKDSEKNEASSLKEAYSKNLRTIASNLRYRISFLILDFLLGLGLIYFFGYIVRSTADLAPQILSLIFLIVFLYVPFAYFYRCGIQIMTELSLNNFILNIRADIEKLDKKKEPQKYTRYLQMDINRLRSMLKQFIDFSEIISPPIYNYEMDRLQRRIDIFFNSTSEVLFPAYGVFSEAQRIEAEYYESQIPPDEEMEESGQEPNTGKIFNFDYHALDEFMEYLGKVLFESVRPYSPFSYRHPINLIRLSRFFEKWNSIVASCINCKKIYSKAEEDVEKYYKEIGRMERQHKQRVRSLTDNVLIVIASVILSTVVGYLIQLASG